MAGVSAQLLVSLTACLLILSALVPSRAEQSRSDQPIKLGTELVVVDAQVVNKKTGKAVGNLAKEDFTVYEDRTKQLTTHFSQDRLPLSVVLVLDTSGSVRTIISRIRDGGLEALEHLKPEDEVALAATASRTELIQTFTRDRKLIASRILSLNEKSLGNGGILMHDAIHFAASLLKNSASPNGRRVIIVVSDDVSTQMPFHGHSEEEALHAAFESGSVACGLIAIGGFARASKYSPASVLFQKLLNPGSIHEYADKTGGIVVNAEKEEVETKLAELIDQIRTRYSIGYVSSNTKRDGKFRRIKVTVSDEVQKREGKLAVQFRRGYYAAQDDFATTKSK